MENARLVLFAALGMVLFLLWQAWQQDYRARSAASTPGSSQSEVVAPASVQQDVPAAPAASAPTAAASSVEGPSAAEARATPTAPADAPRVQVVTDVFRA